jgi:hypothetical protein
MGTTSSMNGSSGACSKVRVSLTSSADSHWVLQNILQGIP